MHYHIFTNVHGFGFFSLRSTKITRENKFHKSFLYHGQKNHATKSENVTSNPFHFSLWKVTVG